MLIRTKSHHMSMNESIVTMWTGHAPHAFTEWGREGLTIRPRAYRCPGEMAPPPDAFLRTEDKILREVRAIRQRLDALDPK